MIEQKQILIGAIIFFAILALYMYGNNVSENLSVPKNVKATGQEVCSAKTCGTTGTRYRDVGCFDPSGKFRMPDGACTGTKPDSEAECSTPACIPWEASANWAPSCPVCGPENVTQTRNVSCPGPDQLNDCNQNPYSTDNPFGKPSSTQSCNNPVCTDWIQPTFEDCPLCGLEETKTLYATSEARCPDGQTCDPRSKPSNMKPCVDIPKCDWRYGNWSGDPNVLPAP